MPLWLVLALVALPAGEAPAAGSGDDGDGLPAVYVGLPMAPVSEDAVRSVLDRARPRVPADTPLQHLDALLSASEVSVLGAGEHRSCRGEPQDPAEYQALRDELFRAFLMQQDTAPRVEQVVAAQLCLAEPLPPEELAWPDFLDAIVAFEKDDLDGARERFTTALSIHPAQEWNDDFPAEARPLFDRARELLAHRVSGELQLAVPDGSRAWIDGREVADPLLAASLSPGRHLIQIGSGGDLHLRAVLLTLEPGRRVLVVDPAAVAPAATGNERLAGNLAALFAQLGAGGSGPAGHVVVMRDDPQVWRWDRVSATFSPMKLVSDVAARRGHRATVGTLTAVTIVGTLAAVAGGVGLAVNGERLGSGSRWITPGMEDDPTLRSWRGFSALLIAGSGTAALGGAGLAVTVSVERRRTRSLTVAAMLDVAPAGERHPHPSFEGLGLILVLR